jgi:predicted nucleic acid-binding protein
MIVVLDASAAIEIVFQRKSGNKLGKYIGKADWVIAPTLFISEVTNTVWKYHKFADLSFKNCENSLEQIMAIPDDFIGEKDLFLEAFKLSCSSNHSVYDMLYLVLARRNSGTLLTMDNKLKKIALHYSIEVS